MPLRAWGTIDSTYGPLSLARWAAQSLSTRGCTMPGHPARSVQLRLIEGARSRPPDLNRPVAPAADYPDPPAWFQPEAVKIYHETIRRMREIAVASEVDYDFLVTFVMTIMVVRECERSFAKVGVARSRK